MEPYMDKVHIAVAGAGSIGVRHIEEIQRSHGAILSAIIDPSPKAIEVGRREDAPVYGSLPEFLAGHRPDGVVLATPNQMHVEEWPAMHRSRRSGIDRKADRPYT